MGELLRPTVEIGEAQPLLARNDPFDLRIQGAKGAEECGKSGREIGDDCAALLVLADDHPAAGSCDPGQHVVELEVEFTRHPNSFAFVLRNLMRRCPLNGEHLGDTSRFERNRLE